MDNLAFPPIQFFVNTSQKYGGIFTFRLGQQRAYFIKSPDYIKDVLVTKQSSFIKEDFLKRGKIFLGEGLVTSDGDVHRRQRRLVQPAFHRERIEACASTMVQFAERAGSRWHDKMEIDMSKEMLHLTLHIVAKTLFNTDVEKDHKDFGKVLTTFLELFNLLVFPLDETGDNPPDQTAQTITESRKRIDEIIYGMIDEKRKSGEDTGDLLSMLMMATDSEDDNRVMSDQQLRDEIVTIFLAGHETIANALSWSWYLLSQNMDAEEKFHAELQNVLADNKTPSIADLPQLQYTRKVFTEAMRLYPPVWALGRMAIEDTTIGNRLIPKGSVILMSQYVTHRDAEYFPQPEEFIPERWTKEMQENLPSFAYFPFGGGARRCIGEQFALTEGISLLATIGQKWRFRYASNKKPEPLFLLTLRPKGALNLIVESRDNEGKMEVG
jgi:cytochrome P450